MDQEPLIQSLRETLLAVPELRKPNYAFALIDYDIHVPDYEEPRMMALMSALRNEPDLVIFDGQMQLLPGYSIRAKYESLATWLIRRAQKIGVEEAVAELQRFINADQLPFDQTMAIAGIEIPNRCSLAEDLELVPWEDLPESDQKTFVHQRFFFDVYHRPTAALLRRLSFPKTHVHPDEYDSDAMIPPVSYETLEDALLCVGVVGPTPVYHLASWMAPPHWAPVGISGYGVPLLEGAPRSRAWPPDGCDQARVVYGQFSALEEARKPRMRLALQRLNSAMRRRSRVDATIDLGIVLETLFLNDIDENRGELSFRLRSRAARYLGSDATERHTLYLLFGDLYAARSKAAHSGKVPAIIRGRPTNELLDEGFSKAAATVTRFLSEGDPDWDQVIVS